MTGEIYQELIQSAEGPGYRKLRLRIALCLLVVTGVRISELRPLKVHQLKTLVESGWIAIDRVKRGPADHKAFLSKKIMQDLKKDFQCILLIKKPNAYVFTSGANHYQKLHREGITKGVNKVMQSVSE